MIKIEINDAAITAALAELAAKLTDMTPIMQDIGEGLTASTKDRFAKGVAPDGTAWAKNSPVTLARKKDTRPLFGSTPAGAALHSQIFYEAGQDYVEVGSNKVYAAVQQFGAEKGAFGAFIGKDKLGRDHFHSIPWGDIPARPFLGVSEDDETEILESIRGALSGFVGD